MRAVAGGGPWNSGNWSLQSTVAGTAKQSRPWTRITEARDEVSETCLVPRKASLRLCMAGIIPPKRAAGRSGARLSPGFSANLQNSNSRRSRKGSCSLADIYSSSETIYLYPLKMFLALNISPVSTLIWQTNHQHLRNKEQSRMNIYLLTDRSRIAFMEVSWGTGPPRTSYIFHLASSKMLNRHR